MAHHQLCIIIIIVICRGVYTPSDVNVQHDGTRMRTHRVKIRAPGKSGHGPSHLFIYFASTEDIHMNLTPLHARACERERETRIYYVIKMFIVLSYIILKLQLNNNRLHRTLSVKHRHLPPPNVNRLHLARTLNPQHQVNLCPDPTSLYTNWGG